MANEKRLIDANAIPKLFEKKYEETEQRILDGETYLDTLAEGFTEADDVILSMPTVDAVEVVHGRWIRNGCHGTTTGKRAWEFTCSECKTLGSPQWKCCPVCTARMDGDGNG